MCHLTFLDLAKQMFSRWLITSGIEQEHFRFAQCMTDVVQEPGDLGGQEMCQHHFALSTNCMATVQCYCSLSTKELVQEEHFLHSPHVHSSQQIGLAHSIQGPPHNQLRHISAGVGVSKLLQGP